MCGVQDECIQRRLLAEKELGYNKAVSLVLGIESAAKSSLTLQRNGRPYGSDKDTLLQNEVHKVLTWRSGGPARCQGCAIAVEGTTTSQLWEAGLFAQSMQANNEAP